jgi:hypothetical protein
LAKESLRATIVGNQSKVPGSFHIKLYWINIKIAGYFLYENI